MLSVLITLWMLLLKLTHDRIPQVILAGDFLYNKEPKLIFPVFNSGKCTACHIYFMTVTWNTQARATSLRMNGIIE